MLPVKIIRKKGARKGGTIFGLDDNAEILDESRAG